MADIKVNSEQLRNTAQQISGELQNFTSLTSSISQDLSSLSSDWEGDAFTSFLDKFNALQPSFSKYEEVINSYVTFLNTTAEEYEANEAAAQSETQNLDNTLFK